MTAKHKSNGKHAADLPPPANVDIERQLLGDILVDATAGVLDLPEVASLRPVDFFDDAHQKVFGAMLALKSEGKPPEAGLVVDRLRDSDQYEAVGGGAYLAKLVGSSVNSSGARHYADVVLSKSRLRDAQFAATLALKQIADGITPDDIDDELAQYIESRKRFRQTKQGPPAMNQLTQLYHDLRPTVVHGLLREGETLNVIAPPKFGKSWLVTALALCVTTGKTWLGFQTTPGRVLIVDNELHPETSTFRIPKVATELGIKQEEYGQELFIANIRGATMDIHKLGTYLADFKPGEFKMIVLDAWYKFIPAGCDENSNADMAMMYALLDSYATRLKCCFVNVHHSTKGSQSGKAVTDIGAGAGAQSRAADSHLVLRQHATDGGFVVDWVARSSPPGQPFAVRWQYPIWTLAPDLDPADLKPDRPRRERKQPDPAEPQEQPWTAERFAAEFVTAEPTAKLAIVDNACGAGLTQTTAEKLLKRAAAKKLIHPWHSTDDRRAVLYASVKQPEVVKEESPESVA